MTRRRRAASISSFVALALSACGRTPVSLPPTPPPLPAAAAPAVSTPAPLLITAAALEAPPIPLPPWIHRVADPACSWGTARWSRRTVTLLRLRPDGPVFARVVGGRAQVHVPLGQDGHGTLDVGSNGLVVSGFVARAHVPLFAASDFAMNGVLFPGSTTPLSWKEGFSDGVSVTMEAPKGIVVNKPPLTAKRPCSDLTLDSGATLAPAKVAFGQAHGSPRLLRAGTVEVFGDPARPADVKLVLAESTFVYSFTTSGAFSRIGLHQNQVYVAGWVRTANLGETGGGGHGGFGGSGGVGIGSTTMRPLRRVTCPSEVPLVAEVGGERATVGHILAGTTIEVMDRPMDFPPVRVESRSIHPAESLGFRVRASDLNACRTLEQR